MDRDWKIGTACALALFGIAFATGEPQAQEWSQPQIAEATKIAIASKFTEVTGYECNSVMVAEYALSGDWVVLCDTGIAYADHFGDIVEVGTLEDVYNFIVN